MTCTGRGKVARVPTTNGYFTLHTEDNQFIMVRCSIKQAQALELGDSIAITGKLNVKTNQQPDGYYSHHCEIVATDITKE